MTEQEKQVAVAAAKIKAWRTLVQNLGFDVGAALVLVLYSAFAPAQGWGDLEWGLLLFTAIKTTVVTGLAYLMRRVFQNFPDA